MIEALQDESLSVKKLSTYALWGQGDRKALIPLINVLNDPEIGLLRLSIEGLSYIGSEKAIIPLIRMLDDNDAWVRNTAIKGLQYIGGKDVLKAIRKYDKQIAGIWRQHIKCPRCGATMYDLVFNLRNTRIHRRNGYTGYWRAAMESISTAMMSIKNITCDDLYTNTLEITKDNVEELVEKIYNTAKGRISVHKVRFAVEDFVGAKIYREY